MAFPEVLHQILSDDNNSDSISWLPSGLSFTIINRDKLVSEILPRYFDGKIKYTSFARKLARWKFVRVSFADGTISFHNKHFRCENPALHEMSSMPSKPTSRSAKTTPPRLVVNKIDSVPPYGSLSLKKRPVDVTKLHRKKNLATTPLKPSKVLLPQPKPIRIRPVTPPRSLHISSSLDIDERTGLVQRRERTSTYKNDARREAIFRLLLQRQLSREGTKAKKHFDQYHGCMSKVYAKALLLERLPTI